jgi:[ribosomal protein S5]-alanine N-acetyltransferase
MAIILRKWKRSDVAALAQIANNKNIADNLRDMFPFPYKKKDAKAWIENVKKQEITNNYCIEVDGAVAGSIGYFQKDDIYRKNVEIGYFIGEEYWGKGIATEAIRLLLEIVSKNCNAVRLYAEVFEHNKASMRALEKNGFYLESIRKKAVIKNGVVMDDCIWVKLAN